MLARYFPRITADRLIAAVHPDLFRLMRANFPNLIVVSPEQACEFDVWDYTDSLPYRFGDTPHSTARDGRPYLRATPSAALRTVAGLRVGFEWCADKVGDWRKNIPLASWRPLFDVPGVSWFCLQKGPAALEAHATPWIHRRCVWWADREARDWLDTAAIVQQLDLVIGRDGAVVHLAGALGRPTWIVLSTAADWRWLHGRSDCVWYPSARLFRQPALFDWPGVISLLCHELEQLSADAAQRPRINLNADAAPD
jgi:hypothetical protein